MKKFVTEYAPSAPLPQKRKAKREKNGVVRTVSNINIMYVFKFYIGPCSRRVTISYHFNVKEAFHSYQE
jgi:hypothetical protein